MRTRTLLFFLCAAGPALWAAGGGGQPSPAPQGQPTGTGLQNEVSVTLKLVRVFVTDRYGKPVTGLSQSDFELLDNGRPQAITAFEAHSLPLPDGPAGRSEGSAPETLVKPDAGRGRKFYFVFDYFMNDPGGIRLAKNATLHFIDHRLKAGDEAGVLALSVTQGLLVLQDMTADRAAAKKAVLEMTGVPKLGSVDETYVRVPGGDDSNDSDEYDGAEAAGEYVLTECNRYVTELTNLARALQAVEGLKNVVFFSRGLALGALLHGGRQLLDTATGSIVISNYNSMLEEMSRAASPVYTVNTEGTRRLPPPGSNAYYNSLAGGSEALVGLADASGGTYFPTAAHSPELTGKIDETTARYYVLGYPIDIAWDGKFHELEVRVKRSGCQARAQAGFYDPKRFADLTPLEKDTHLMDLVRGRISPFLAPDEVPVGLLSFSAGHATSNAFMLAELDPACLAEVSGAELGFFVLDGTGKIVWSRKSKTGTDIRSGAAAFAYAPLALPPGRYEGRFTLRDLDSGRTALGSCSMTIPAEPSRAVTGEADGFRFDAILLVRPGRKALFIRVAGEKDLGERLSLADVFPFVSVQAAPLVGALEAAQAPLSAIVRVSPCPGASLPDLDWTARFVRIKPGLEESAEVREIMRQPSGDATAFLIVIERPALEPGEYALEIMAHSGDLERRAGTEVRIRVK
jgi:VWFA-related protein